MARKPNDVIAGDDVHTVFRTRNREFLFLEFADHELFLKSIRRQAERYGVQHYAWVGMSNHHHLFHQTPTQWHCDTPFAMQQRKLGAPIPPSAMIRDTQSFFVSNFNTLKSRDGGLIRDRTKMIKVYEDRQILALLLYIFLNPVRAGIVRHPRDYPFSNFSQYSEGRSRFDGLFSVHPSFRILGSTTAARQKKFCHLVEESAASWALKSWPGASSAHTPGRHPKQTAYDEFTAFASQWFESRL